MCRTVIWAHRRPGCSRARTLGAWGVFQLFRRRHTPAGHAPICACWHARMGRYSMFVRLLAATLLASLSPTSGAAGADAPLPTVSGPSFASAPVTLSNCIKGTIISFESRTPTECADTIHAATETPGTHTAQIFFPFPRQKEQPQQ